MLLIIKFKGLNLRALCLRFPHTIKNISNRVYKIYISFIIIIIIIIIKRKLNFISVALRIAFLGVQQIHKFDIQLRGVFT
jgi:hypothetical protein